MGCLRGGRAFLLCAFGVHGAVLLRAYLLRRWFYHGICFFSISLAREKIIIVRFILIDTSDYPSLRIYYVEVIPRRRRQRASPPNSTGIANLAGSGVRVTRHDGVIWGKNRAAIDSKPSRRAMIGVAIGTASGMHHNFSIAVLLISPLCV